MASDDVQLLRDCLDGKPGAWEAFVEGFAPLIAEACRRTLKRLKRPAGSQEVADMLQTVFLSLLEQDMRTLRGYRGQGMVSSYLATVSVRRVLDDRSLAAPEPGGPPPGRPDSPPGPADALEAREARELLQGELARLSPRSRLALTLQADGLPLKEIGSFMTLSPDAVAHLLMRARETLRHRLADP